MSVSHGYANDYRFRKSNDLAHHAPMSPSDSDRVYVFDTTLRDGEQSPGCSMTVSEKVELASALVDLGVDVLEAGFPIASEGDLEAVSTIARTFPWARGCALGRACRPDIALAARALAPAQNPRIHTFIATSPIHLRHKLRKTEAQVLEEAVEAVRLARRYVDDVEFSAEDGARTDPAFLERIATAVVDAGASTVNIPDTVGYAIPAEYGALIGRIVGALAGRAIVSVHCHDDLGLAVANSVAAIQAGARQVECTINGIGERAGNCSLEEIVMILRTRRDVLPQHTAVRAELLYPTSQRLSAIVGFGVQPNKAIVGANAFAHEAGIHQDGYLKDKSTYEIIDPHAVGVPESRLVLGKHSGRHALRKRCEDLGLPLSVTELDLVYARFTALADRKKGILDAEIADLVRQARAQAVRSASA